MLVPLKVKSISASNYKSGDFALTTIYMLSNEEQSCEIYASINGNLYLIDGLKANMLVSNNMLYIEGFIINLFNSSTLIHSCGVKIDINAKQHLKFLR